MQDLPDEAAINTAAAEASAKAEDVEDCLDRIEGVLHELHEKSAEHMMVLLPHAAMQVSCCECCM